MLGILGTRKRRLLLAFVVKNSNLLQGVGIPYQVCAGILRSDIDISCAIGFVDKRNAAPVTKALATDSWGEIARIENIEIVVILHLQKVDLV